MTVDNIFRAEVLLSMQRALWDMVTPDIRGVSVRWDTNFIGARFIYDHPVSVEETVIVSEVEGYVLADFDEDMTSDFAAEFIPQDQPRIQSDGEWWAYLRREIRTQ